MQKIDSVLKYLKNKNNQNSILTKNFKFINRTDQLIDKLYEILVAYEFLNKNPCFFDDNMGKPDIYLEKSNQYIEVKRINISDKEKSLLELLISNNRMIGHCSDKLQQQNKMENAVSEKAKSHINKALEQIKKVKRTKNIIFLLYHLDFDLKNREKSFENKVELFFKTLPNNKNTSLIIECENNLLK